MLRGAVSWPDDKTIFESIDTGPYIDGNVEIRLKNKLYFSNWASLDTDYEFILLGGDTYELGQTIETLFPAFSNLLFIGFEDDRRFMDLTKTIHRGEDYVLYHRLDRFFLTLRPEWGILTIGRQAITWGNGLLFNPMDLFNPFSPTDIERNYKVGDDMVVGQFPIDPLVDLQLLYVPRRNLVSDEVQWDQSSLAGKLHLTLETTDFDVMAASHYSDAIIGLGNSGYIGDAAWRLDGVWTFLDDDTRRDGFLSLVANLDYSWVWRHKNFYGMLEFYYNGLGQDDYSMALLDPDILERRMRGEIFTLGRAYLGGHLKIELHPLFNFHLTLINNLADPSGIIQPRATWNITQNLELLLGAEVYYGDEGTEYGGFEIPGTSLLLKAPARVTLRLAYFF
ncbi:hypothetical protein ACFL9T_10995 [Thermodesulfobacteriota bacterium]